MLHLYLPPGDYSIRPKGAGVEILTLDRDIPREEVALQLGRTERSIDLYRTLNGPAQLKSHRIGGRVYIKESELRRWLTHMNKNPSDYSLGDRPRKKRRTRLALNERRNPGREISQTAAELSTTA